MEDKQRTILILNIKIDKDHTDDLTVHENDEPEEIAEKFCAKHSLPRATKLILIKHIEDNLDAFIEEEVSTTNISSLLNTQPKLFNAPETHKRSSSAKNYGEVLYNKGILMKQKVKHMIQLQKQNLLEKEMQETTFTPKIHQYNKKNRNVSFEYQKRQNSKNLEDQNLTFKPKINKIKRKEGQPQIKTDKCIELYKKAKEIKEKKEEKVKKIFDKIYPFQPQTSKKSIFGPLKKAFKDYNHSISYLQQVKLQEHKSLFMSLNPNTEGIINKTTVSRIQLSPPTYSKVGRIVQELIDLNEELTFDQFSRALDIISSENQSKISPGYIIKVPSEFD